LRNQITNIVVRASVVTSWSVTHLQSISVGMTGANTVVRRKLRWGRLIRIEASRLRGRSACIGLERDLYLRFLYFSVE
jgi:hypothetical protein